MEYNCPCGKKHKSRNTVSRHKKALAEKDVLLNVPKDVPKDKKGQVKGQQEDKKGQEKGQVKGQQEDKKGQEKGQPEGQNVLKEINLKGEFDKMTETIDPKKGKEETEPKYKCGACQGTFNEKHKHCPHCGAEF